MNRTKKIGLICGVIVFVGIILFLIINQVSSNQELQKYQNLFEEKEVVAALPDIIFQQEKLSLKIQEVLNNQSCSFDDLCVIENPFEISPLTALIIFQTSDEVEVSVSINDVRVTTMESSKVHSIPIYGLRAGIENKVLLEINGQKKEVLIDCKDVSVSGLQTIVSNENATLDQDVYFVSSPTSIGASAYDGFGNLIWYLNENYSQDIEWTKNGHMYLGNGVSSGIAENYDGFYEIDYLGKIYKNYSLKNGYHHELISLSDGTIIVAGGNDTFGSSYIASFVYHVNPETGEILNSFDVFDLFSKIDESFAKLIRGTNVLINSIYYEEDTKEMILSLRGISSVLSLNFETKEIHWILGDPTFYSSAFAPYLLQMSDGSRLPKGQHSAFKTKDGYLGLFNNDFDIMDPTSPYLDYYKNNYSSAVLYEIDGKNIKTHWEYDAGKQYFTYALGNFEYSENSKLVNFGWAYKPEAFLENHTIYENFGNTYGRIIELDANDQIIFQATNEYGIYRTYKHRFYEEVTPNYLTLDFHLVNNNPTSSLEKVATKDFYESFQEAKPNTYDFDLTSNTIQFNVIFDNSEVVDLYFVSEEKFTYVLNYKKKDEVVPLTLNLRLHGNYAVYVKIDDQMYDTGKIFSFN